MINLTLKPFKLLILFTMTASITTGCKPDFDKSLQGTVGTALPDCLENSTVDQPCKVTREGLTVQSSPILNVCSDGGNPTSCMAIGGAYVYSQVFGGRDLLCNSGLNTGACWSDLPGQYLTSISGNNMNIASISTAIPSGYYDGSQTVTISDAQLIATNISSGVNILGVTGRLPALNSSLPHDPGVASLKLIDESHTGSGAAYTSTTHRAVPNMGTDHDSSSSRADRGVSRIGWGGTTCGLTGTIDQRIASCHSVFGSNATWDGRVRARNAEGIWRLVSRTGGSTGTVTNITGQEVWRDEITGLLWSSRVAIANWCILSGVNNIPGNPSAQPDSNAICTNSTYQNTTGLAISACYEDGEINFTSSHASISIQAKAGLGYSSTPRVAWRLPTIYDLKQAEIDGIRFVVPGFMDNSEYAASATLIEPNSAAVWGIQTGNGNVAFLNRSNDSPAYCVGR